MRNYFLILLLFSSFNILSQNKVTLKTETEEEKITTQDKNGADINMTIKEAKKEFGEITEGVSFGLSLGYNFAMESLKTAQISPLDKTLIISDAQADSFVLSTVISVPITYKTKKIKRKLDKNGNAIGQVYTESDVSVIGVVNLVQFSGATNGSIFNQKISGGLGISYNMNDNVAFGLSYELLSYRKPKDFLLEENGNALMANGNEVTTLAITDDNYFFDRYAGTLALKVIYKLTTK